MALQSLKRVPWIIWALLAPAVILGLYRWVVGGGRRINIAGSGPVSQVQETDAPEGLRFVLNTQADEELAATRARIEEEITHWPDVLVFGFDSAVLDHGPGEARVAIEELTQSVENAVGVPVVLGFTASRDAPESRRAAIEELGPWFRALCAHGYRVCVDLAPHGDDPDAMRAAIVAGVRDGIARHDAWRATTQ